MEVMGDNKDCKPDGKIQGQQAILVPVPELDIALNWTVKKMHLTFG